MYGVCVSAWVGAAMQQQFEEVKVRGWVGGMCNSMSGRASPVHVGISLFLCLPSPITTTSRSPHPTPPHITPPGDPQVPHRRRRDRPRPPRPHRPLPRPRHARRPDSPGNRALSWEGVRHPLRLQPRRETGSDARAPGGRRVAGGALQGGGVGGDSAKAGLGWGRGGEGQAARGEGGGGGGAGKGWWWLGVVGCVKGGGG